MIVPTTKPWIGAYNSPPLDQQRMCGLDLETSTRSVCLRSGYPSQFTYPEQPIRLGLDGGALWSLVPLRHLLRDHTTVPNLAARVLTVWLSQDKRQNPPDDDSGQCED